MTILNEAEGLLLNGAMYPRRIGLRAPEGSLDLVGVKHAGFALYRGDGPFFHFDLDGRWQRLMVGATHFLRALDGSVEAVDRTREDGQMRLVRRACPFAEAADLDDLARRSALEVLAAVDAGRTAFEPPPGPGRALEAVDLRVLLERVTRWDAAAWFRQRELYLATYGPLGPIPPDARQALILQATDEDGHRRSTEQFRQHVRDVRRLLGARLAQPRSVYLAGAAAFHQPAEQVEGWLQAAGEVLGITDAAGPPRPGWLRETEARIDSIQGLLDDFGPPLPPAEAWGRFAAMHLGRMTLAPKARLEAADSHPVIAGLKAAALAVSVVLPAEADAELLVESALGAGDQVFLAGAIRLPASERFESWRRARGVKVLRDPAQRGP